MYNISLTLSLYSDILLNKPCLHCKSSGGKELDLQIPMLLCSRCGGCCHQVFKKTYFAFFEFVFTLIGLFNTELLKRPLGISILLSSSFARHCEIPN